MVHLSSFIYLHKLLVAVSHGTAMLSFINPVYNESSSLTRLCFASRDQNVKCK